MIDYWLHHNGTAHLVVNLVCTILAAGGLRLFRVSYARIALVAALGIALGGLTHAFLIDTPIVGASGGWFSLLGYLLSLRFGVLAFAGIAIIVAGHAVFDTYLGLLIHSVAYGVGAFAEQLLRARKRRSVR
ncbi:MAG: hypothetical protein AAGK37_23350 [Pseudomonadota bacterium]